jgi:Cu2+-exporting ATPase
LTNIYLKNKKQEDFLTLNFQTGTLTRGKPVVSAIGSIHYGESEILQIAAAVEKTASHPIAKAIINKAESLELVLPLTKGQIVEPGFGTLAEVDGRLVAVGSLEWVHERFKTKMNPSDLMNLERSLMNHSSSTSSSKYSKTVVYVGLEGEGIIGVIAISDIVREDAESTVTRYSYYFLCTLQNITTHFRQVIILLLLLSGHT